ncbi:hypothetical protein SAMD00019534_045080 [Acytostelium subglobosum LB1]|uniref:hypothetical protein n=1 Tax=Acytostelium subglobosum LB1 TaxID=1410327 RepID=UPI0006449170|nr:hypothetical protein SAMD00019534_045080 [Acytostelium subglobosum LB1]GAM21333.1 hypothetical protein SAMD00019534_045080 [Acytostelium subglobosum LB1]|eukprot:XP_012755452.1 hypothetical protein SAMD00019534_045080 [Acytostelium subglobosum LB1]
METTKKSKSSSTKKSERLKQQQQQQQMSSPDLGNDEEQQQQQQQQEEDVNMSEPMQPTQSPPPPQPKEKKKKAKASKSTTSSQTSVDDDVVAQPPRTPTAPLRTPQRTPAPQQPQTPLSRLLTPSQGTPMTPSRSSLTRLREREDIADLTQKLAPIAGAFHQTALDYQRKLTDLSDQLKGKDNELANLRAKLAESEKSFQTENNRLEEATENLESTQLNLKRVEEQLLNERNHHQHRLDEAIEKITLQQSTLQASLTSEVHKLRNELDIVKANNSRLESDLATKESSAAEKTQKLLGAEYERMKGKQEELRTTIKHRENDIRRLKEEILVKDKQLSDARTTEAEHKQTIESHERRIEDIMESQGRDLEQLLAAEMGNQSARIMELESLIHSNDIDKDELRSQLNVLQDQQTDISVKNHELEDQIHHLTTQLRQKDESLAKAVSDNAEQRKENVRLQAEISTKDLKINMLHKDVHNKELRNSKAQEQIADLSTQVQMITSIHVSEPEVPLTNVIQHLRDAIQNIETQVYKKPRNEDDYQFGGMPVQQNEMHEQQHEQQQVQGDQEMEAPPVEPSASINSVDVESGLIQLKLVNMSIADWKLIVHPAVGDKRGFHIKASTEPSTHLVNVWVGRSRLQNDEQLPFQNTELYWDRKNVWGSVTEGTKIFLLTETGAEVEVITLPKDGKYTPNNGSSNCLIM